MLKLLFLFLLLWSCGQVLGQGTAVTKSNDIVVIRGKSYYLHTVQPGQTLYSICKAYGANIDEVKSSYIKVVSELGQGSEFSIMLPVR